MEPCGSFTPCAQTALDDTIVWIFEKVLMISFAIIVKTNEKDLTTA